MGNEKTWDEFARPVGDFTTKMYELYNGHHVVGVVVSDSLGRRLGLDPKSADAVHISTPTGQIAVHSAINVIFDAFKRAEQLRVENDSLKQQVVNNRAEIDRLNVAYIDAKRDSESYRLRLEDLQRRVSAVADSMNYSFPGGKRP